MPNISFTVFEILDHHYGLLYAIIAHCVCFCQIFCDRIFIFHISVRKLKSKRGNYDRTVSETVLSAACVSELSIGGNTGVVSWHDPPLSI